MLAWPDASPSVGVKTAARTVPLVLTALSVPPETTMSLLSKLLPGSSVKLKLIAAVWPRPSKATDLVRDTVGATVSMLMTGVAAPVPALPAASL